MPSDAVWIALLNSPVLLAFVAVIVPTLTAGLAFINSRRGIQKNEETRAHLETLKADLDAEKAKVRGGRRKSDRSTP